MTNLVIQSFGRENEYKRAILTVLSFYANTSAPVTNTKVLLFTDQPNYFDAYFKELPVTYILLRPEKIKQMRGEINFLHRMKIALIEEAFGVINGPMIYVDSDTFFIADPISLLDQVSEETSFMHTREYQFKEKGELGLAGHTDPFLNLITTNIFYLSDHSCLQVSSEWYSWNAGVMILHPSHQRFLKDVYALTNQFYRGSKSHASEQNAFGIMLQLNTQVLACEDIVYHYWYKTKKEIIDNYLNTNINEHWSRLSLPEKLTAIRHWTRLLPTHLQNHFLTLQNNAILAFSNNRYAEGYKWAGKALLKKTFGSLPFIKDVLYYTRRRLLNR